ncbi:DUF6082 family protein [Actinoplanes sp. NBC_00393]|uniref:DUF6082 family protein n=1 Tax=Actinoplanes sp. NBC_00393 TaxID=2975953 RepID=UPI002E1A5BED
MQPDESPASFIRPARAPMIGGSAPWVLIGVAVLLIVIASPAAIAWFAGYRDDWSVLSDVGQAYGLASAVLSGAALLTIALSLVHQANQTRIAQKQASRTMQLELFRLAYQYPDLQEVWAKEAGIPHGQWRKDTYRNMIFMYLRMLYAMRESNDASLRRMMTNRFKSRPAREYWAATRGAHAAAINGRRDRRFFALTDEAYQQSLNTPALPDADPDLGQSEETTEARGPAPRASKPALHPIGWAILGALGGAGAAAVLIRRGRAPRSGQR